VPIIDFYGAHDRAMFALERKAMDPAMRVTDAHDRALPERGLVLDVGAGDGFSADRLTTRSRRVMPMKQAVGMIRKEQDLPWVRGDAELLPFRDGSFAGAYATWAFEFETYEEADRLLGFYFGDRGRNTGKLRFAFRVGLYFNRSRGSGR
jgi:hypothetical protein